MTKHCWKMKRKQRYSLSSMVSKCDMTRQRDNVDQRRGGTEEMKERRC
jgi:hypothetical protein